MNGAMNSIKRYVPGFVRRGVSAGRFTATKYLFGYRVPATPHFDEPGQILFRDILSRTTRYLEYGMGASTVLAWQTADVVVAVESDVHMLAAVRRALSSSGRNPRLSRLILADIGFTKEWGKPVFTRPTRRRLARWESYAMAPWAFLKQHAIVPETILIDGRFRVACALVSLLNLERASPCVLLVDDYGDRPHYRMLEDFADRASTQGCMALFRKKADFDAVRCLQALQVSNRDWR
jgi:hypothetical protein